MRRTILFYFGLIWYKSINLDRDISWWCKPMHAFCLTWIYLAGWMLISNSGFNKQLHWPICRWEKYLITIFLPVTCVRFILLSILFLFSNYLFIYHLSLTLSLSYSIYPFFSLAHKSSISSFALIPILQNYITIIIGRREWVEIAGRGWNAFR